MSHILLRFVFIHRAELSAPHYPTLLTSSMLETILIIVLVLWLLGFSFRVGGNLIHTLLVVALILFIIRLLS